MADRRLRQPFTTRAGGARIPTLKELSRGQPIPPANPNDPFADAETKREFSHYAYDSQGAAAMALRIPAVARAYRTNPGSGPKMVVLGAFLERGWLYNENLFLKLTADTLRLPLWTGSRVLADITAVRGGREWLILVEGPEFRRDQIAQVLSTQFATGQYHEVGTPVIVTYEETLNLERLASTFRQAGVW